jgi:hypothetical protein
LLKWHLPGCFPKSPFPWVSHWMAGRRVECYGSASGSVDILALALESQTFFRIAMVIADEKGFAVLVVSCSGS